MSSLLNALPPQQRRGKPLRISTDVPLLTRYSSSPSAPTDRSITSSGAASSTGNLQYFFDVLCMHDFESLDPIHLPFHKDEVLTIIKQDHSGWWAAMRPQGDRIGWIPASFVLSLDRSNTVEYESLNDIPLSAVHDPWVPVSEDYRALSFQLVTPTDLALYNGFFNDGVHSYDCESIIHLLNDERSADVGDICVPLTPESTPPQWTGPHLPQGPVQTAPVLQLAQPTGPPVFDAPFHHDPRPREVHGQTSLLHLTITSDRNAPDLMSGLDIKDCLVMPKSVVTSHDCTYSDDGTQLGQPQSFALPASYRIARPDQGVPDVNLLDPKLRDPGDLAEQICVLMHTLYANIHQHDCLDWMAGRKGTDMTGLRQFFDIHNNIALWVEKSVLAYDDMAQQIGALDFWIRVAEKCQALRNFDSLCAIVLALSGSSVSSLGSAWARCTQKQTFAMLRNILDVSNNFRRLMNIMDSAKGPSVPFVHKYLDDIKELRVERSSNGPRQSGYATEAGSSAVWRMQLVAVSNMLRHQSSPYDFKVHTG